MAKKQEQPPLVYADSDVYLDLIQKSIDLHPVAKEPRWKVAASFFQAVDEGRVRLAASALTQAEVACNGDSRRESQRIRVLLDAWWTDPKTEWREVDRYIAREGGRLAGIWHAKHEPGKRFKSADAIHLAAAVDLGCDYLFTYDGGFPHGHTVEGVVIARPSQVWPESLLDLAVGE